MTSHEAEQYLNSFINYEKDLNRLSQRSMNLDRVRALLELIGNPHNKMKFIHVAGTKGKGSICTYISTILKCAGYKVGLYTSPHLNDMNERIRILNNNNEENIKAKKYIYNDCICDDVLCSLVNETKSEIEKVRNNDSLGKLTYFEVLTVLAIYYFYKEKTDFVVLETGLGGRLDATNVVNSLVCGIATIGLEHQHILGDSIEAIAKEKAAIVKNNEQVVMVAPQEKKALNVIKERCDHVGASAYYVNTDIEIQKIYHREFLQYFNIKGIYEDEYCLDTSLLGSCQSINAAVAVGVIESLKRFNINIKEEFICEGIRKAVFPGRFEMVSKCPDIIIDCAHTTIAFEKLVIDIKNLFGDKQISLILGLSEDKDAVKICQLLDSVVKEVVLTKSSNPRAAVLNSKKIASLFEGKKCIFTDTVKEAVEYILSDIDNKEVVFITGSVFVVGEAREILLDDG